jgi:Actinobacteria/chloroflexi VLRF1 release factor
MGHCVVKNPAAGGGRWLEVPPERLVTWVVTFAERHGGAAQDRPVTAGASGATVTFTAADGATAECHPPFPPFPPLPPGVPSGVRAAAEALAAHAAADRTVGVLLVRLGGYAAGVFSGSPPRLADSRTGSRPVHGRSAAGGWSQQRFARRRENQAATALRAAADAAVEVFGRYGPDRLDAVVLGGDKRSAAGLAVLRDIPHAFLATRIRLTEPESISPVTG